MAIIKEELKEEHKVGISGYKAARSPHKLITLGLGSCVGIVLFDASNRVGGLSHIMLPNSAQFKNNGNKGKFPDTAIPLLLEEMAVLGAQKRLITAKIAGGARMFISGDKQLTNNIGERNIQQTLEVLGKLGIKVLAADVGGNKGRTVIFDIEEGKVWVRSLGKQLYEL